MARWKKTRYVRPEITMNDAIRFINDYFRDLRRKLKFNRVVDRIDMELPRFIIRRFKELFDIWDNNLLLTKCLDKALFEGVYNSMADVFEICHSDTSDGFQSTYDSSYLECSECGEEIVLRNNNHEYSVAYHNASRQHLEFIDNFVKVRKERETKRCKKQEDEQIVSKDTLIDTPASPTWLEKCDCDEEFAPKDNVQVENALVEHEKSLLDCETYAKEEPEDIEFVTQVINEQGVTVVICHLCRVTISIETSSDSKINPIDAINSHKKGELHVLNLYWFGLQRTNIRVKNKENSLIECTLCNETFALDCFHDHFYAGSTSPHSRRMLLASINVENLRKNVSKLKIYYITRLNSNEGMFMKCHLCHVLIRAVNSHPDDQESVHRYLDDAVNTHQDSEDHILNLFWFESQNCYIKVYDIKENLIECTLCEETFRLDSFYKHFYGSGSSNQHERRVLLASIHSNMPNLKNAVSEMKIDHITQIENDAGTFMRCHICHVLIPTVVNNEKLSHKCLTDAINLHQQGEDHLMNLYWLQLQKTYIEVYDRKQNIIRCTLCNLSFHLDSFYDHFYGGSNNQHNRRALLTAIRNRTNKSTVNVQ